MERAGGKTSQGTTKTALEERQRQTERRNKYPAAEDPAEGRNATLAPAQEAQRQLPWIPL